MEQYERARERVCNACSSELFQKCNTKCENFFYKLGYYTAIYAPIILVTSIIVFLALGFGIWEGNSKSELYYLWIPSGSRLLGEREYTDIHHGGYASRTEYLMANPKGNVQEMMKVPVQDQVFSMFNASMHNITVRDRSLSYPVGFYQLCSRVPTPAALLGILRLTGGLGLPCTIYSGTDCYQEGSFANDIPPAAVAITAAAGSSTLTSKYASEPSYKNLTSEQMWSKMGGYWGGTYTGQSCTNWARVPIPENFMFGGVDRMPLPSHNVTRVGSLQMVMQLKTPEQFAKWKCVEDCSARKSCALTTGACVDPNFDPTGVKTGVVPGSCQSNITSVYTPQCFAACSQSPDPNVTAPFMKCVGVDVCYNSNATACNVPQNPLAQLCNACATTANLSLAVPPCSTCVQACGLSSPAFVNCVKACVTPKVVGCATACAAAGSMCEISCQNECAHSVNSSDVAEAEDTIMRWEQSFLDFMERQENSSNYLFEVNYFAERSTDDLTSLAGDADAKLIIAGYIAMIVFGCLTLVRPCDPLQSKFMLGFGGMLLIIISIIGTLGFSALVGIVYVPTIIQVMPFLALGMGTYDMFSLAFGFQYYPQRSIPDMIGELLRDAGPRLTLASASNIVAFGIGTNIPITAVYWLAAAMCIMMLFSWIILIFGFTALIALHAERIRKNQVDTLCCFTTSKRSSEIRVEREEQLGWLSQKVTDFVFWWPVKIFLFIGTIIIFAVAMWGATQLRIGLPLSDIVPEDHYSYGFLKARDQSYGSFNSYIITGYVAGKSYDLDYSDYNVLASLMRMERQMEKVSGSDANAPIWQTSWIENFLRWCRRNSTGCAENQNANHPTDIILLENTPTGVVNYTTGFWPLKSRFQISLAEFLGAQEGLNYAQYLEQNVTTGVIISSRILFVQRGLDNDELVIDYIVASRKVTDACTVACFPQGLLYNLYEQYVDTQHYLTTNLGYTVIGVVLICCFFLLHPGAVLIMVGIIVLTIAEVYGYLALFDLKLNGVSVVNLILAIGIVVAPVAHITRVFMVTEGSNQERAKFALARMVSPMLWSTISTFIGELPMQFARFPYFRLYFFHMYVLIGLLTLFNSFIVLPYGLEYFGPPPVRERENNNKSTSPEGVDLALPGLEDASGE